MRIQSTIGSPLKSLPEKNFVFHQESPHSPVDTYLRGAGEFTDAIMHTVHLKHKFADPIRVGVAGVAARSLARPGLENKLEGLAAAGLAVSSVATLFHGGAGSLALSCGECLRGASETALGLHQVHTATQNHAVDKVEFAKGIVNCTKGVTTFLPLLFPQTATAVGVVHFGLVGANLVLDS